MSAQAAPQLSRLTLRLVLLTLSLLLVPHASLQYGGTPPEQCDPFHDLILIDELSRCASGGILWACFFTFGIALPPVLNVGSQHVKDLCARDVITGKKIMALAVTEPQAGSDVANLTTTADVDGDFYVVNGLKKFISGGMKADWFTVRGEKRSGGEMSTRRDRDC